MLSRARSVFAELKAAMDLIADPSNHPLMFHCEYGKDRTGILCALTHHALGVSMDDIFIDYELTNTAASVEDRLPEAAAYFNDMLSKSSSTGAAMALR